MPKTEKLRRIHIQSGAQDGMLRKIPGIFEVFLDDDAVVEMMEQAYSNRTKRSKCGPLVVQYRPAREAVAEYIVAQERKREETA